MAKVLCVKDVCFNYDYAVLLQKNHISEELENVALSSLKKVLESLSEDVTTVLLLGDLFLEDVLLVDQVDKFTQLISEFEGIEFIVAPQKNIQEDGWYHIINWPGNCSLISQKVNYYDSKKNNLILYEGKLNDTLGSNDSYKLSVSNKWNKDIPRFLPDDFSNKAVESVYVIDTDAETVESSINDSLVLYEFTVEVDDQMTIDEIGKAILSHKKAEDHLVFYRCILSGLINPEMDKDFINNIRESVAEGLECIYVNKTFKNYDVESIKNDNKDNLIGIFIKNVQEINLDEEEEKRIIETGLDYLL